MSSDQDAVRLRYADPAKEEARHSRSRADGMEFLMTRKLLEPFITPETDVVEFGCASGYYAGLWQERSRCYLGVDLTPENVEYFNSRGFANARAQVGDAAHCPEIPSGSFDVVLCLGPMYHLPPEGRARAMAEMIRICKPGGTLAFAYIPNAGVMLWAVANRIRRKELPWRKRRHGGFYPNRKGNESIFSGVNDSNPCFLFTMPEEMEALAKQHGLRVVQNAGVDIKPNMDQINHMNEEQYACWLELAEYLLQFPSVAGAAGHALMICAKEGAG
ncbi:MAG: class I SAM-dependent methyltransferase [Oscillospiraceae bacterium]|nr:class I SAM-dependent methyltransferase [Oscillospiraceae bacterium]